MSNAKEGQYAPPSGPPPNYPQQPAQAYATPGQETYNESRGAPFGGQPPPPQGGYYGGQPPYGQPGYGYGQPQPGMYYQQPYYGGNAPPGGYYGNRGDTAAEGCCVGLLGALCCLDLCLIF